MNKEIKEILETLDGVASGDWIQMLPKEAIKLENYITNLQEELKETNESLTWWTNRFNAVERDNRKLKQENQKLVKVFDELEEYILNHYIVGHTVQNASLDDILNKLTELKGETKK